MKVTNCYGVEFCDSNESECCCTKEFSIPLKVCCTVKTCCNNHINCACCQTESEKECPGCAETKFGHKCNVCGEGGNKCLKCGCEDMCEDGTGVNLYVCGKPVFEASLCYQCMCEAFLFFSGK